MPSEGASAGTRPQPPRGDLDSPGGVVGQTIELFGPGFEADARALAAEFGDVIAAHAVGEARRKRDRGGEGGVGWGYVLTVARSARERGGPPPRSLPAPAKAAPPPPAFHEITPERRATVEARYAGPPREPRGRTPRPGPAASPRTEAS